MRRPRRKRQASSGLPLLVVEGACDGYRRTPCESCPWKMENVGRFSIDAFRQAAPISHERALPTLACHEVGSKKPSFCAGFLLRSEGNLTVRRSLESGTIDLSQVTDDGMVLFLTYAEMSIANGVPFGDPTLVDVTEAGVIRQP
jgi:hypothetical protein